MFEQTLLTQPASAQKTGAFAVSLTAQMCVLGVLVIGPLLYTQTLPFIPLKLGITLGPPPPPPPPPPVTQTRTDVPSGPSLSTPTRRIFVPREAPSSPPSSSAPDVLAPVGAPVDFGDHVEVGPIGALTGGGPTGLPQFKGDPTPTRVVAVATPIVESPAKPVTVSGAVLASKLITKVVPQYPGAARTLHVSGVVRLLGIIGVDGHVKSLRALEGHPLLRKAAEDAVWQWVYSPTYLTGKPVEVEASIEVNFALN